MSFLSDRTIQEALPAGVIFTYAGSSAPAGWLLCEGQAVSRTTYARLFAQIGTSHGYGDNSTTFNLPDYRGRFLRGVDGSAGQDPDKTSRSAMNTGGNTGNNVGSVQGDQFGSHNHGGGEHTHSFTAYRSNGTNNPNNAIGSPDIIQNAYTVTTSGAGTIISTQGGNENRSKNAYVNYIIKI